MRLKVQSLVLRALPVTLEQRLSRRPLSDRIRHEAGIWPVHRHHACYIADAVITLLRQRALGRQEQQLPTLELARHQWQRCRVRQLGRHRAPQVGFEFAHMQACLRPLQPDVRRDHTAIGPAEG